MGRRKQNMSLKYKKGNVYLDIMLVVVILFGMAIVGLIAHNLLGELNSDIQADSDLSALTKATSQSVTTGLPSWLDNAFLFATVLLWLFIIVASFVVDSHPAFLIVGIILLLFAFGIVMMLSNSFAEFTDDPEFSGLSSDFPITFWIMDNLLTVAIVFGGSSLIALYGKNKFVGG